MMPCEFAGLANEKPTYPGEQMFQCVHGKVLTWRTARACLGLPPERQERKKRMSEVTEAQENLLEHKANCVLCMHLPDTEVDTSCITGLELLTRWNEAMEVN